MSSDELHGFPDAATRRLYEKALDGQWHAQRDVAWNAIELGQVPVPIRTAMAEVYAQVIHAENFGLGVCGRLVDELPAGWARQIFATQVMDEARHVDFFSEVLHRLEMQPVPGAVIREIGDSISALRRPVEIVLAGHLLEIAAHTLFLSAHRLSSYAAGTRTVRLPGSEGPAALMAVLMELVGRDEARHLAIGIRALKAWISILSYKERAALEGQAMHWCGDTHNFIESLRLPLARLGISARPLREKVWRAQRHNLALVGLHIERVEDPFENRGCLL